MTVHNHGPAEGPGLNCPERMSDTGLRGACLPEPYCDHGPMDACRCSVQAPLTVTAFLLARVHEDERQARAALPDRWGETHRDGANWAHDLQSSDRDATAAQDAHAVKYWPGRILAECEAKRAIIRQHETWPVLVEREPSPLEILVGGLESVTYRMTSEIAWLTTKKYIEAFGTEPPTAPLIAALAYVYREHPDYRPEWAAE